MAEKTSPIFIFLSPFVAGDHAGPIIFYALKNHDGAAATAMVKQQQRARQWKISYNSAVATAMVKQQPIALHFLPATSTKQALFDAAQQPFGCFQFG